MRMTRTMPGKLLFALFISFFLFAGSVFAEPELGAEEIIPGQYIVVFNDTVSDADQVEEELTGRARAERLQSYRYAIRGFSARLSADAAAALASDPRVAFVGEDRTVSIIDAESRIAEREAKAAERVRDIVEARQGNDAVAEASRDVSQARRNRPIVSTPSSSQTLPTGIDRINAEGKTNNGEGVHVAVIDTGIASHPDLDLNIAGGKNCLWSGDYRDQNGHGTHVAGTIAALDNTLGVVGVAPEAKLWSVRVLDKNGNGSWSSVICGLDFVASKGPANGGPISVANLSLGGSGASDNNCGFSNNDALHRAVCRVRDAGITLVVAAGNSGKDAAQAIPAAYNDAVITVSALVDTDGKPNGNGSSTGYGADDTFASFSNWGAPVDIGAPGVNINSTWLSGGYKTISGTSMASPHVAGAAALFIAANPGALWSDVRAALIGNGEGIGAGHTDPSGKHSENVLRADSL